MTAARTKPAPAAPRRGRPALLAGEASIVAHVRLTPELKAKLDTLGGSAWLREAVRRAKVPAP